MNGQIERFPTYFEIRNFLEIDLDFLIKNKKIDYAELLLGSLSLLVNCNQEVYKYAARVLLENNIYNAAENYMQKAKDVLYNDAELHFILAKYNIVKKEYKNALFYIQECLKLIPSYYPAKILKKEVEQLITRID